MKSIFSGLSAGTVLTKETKEPNNRVLLGALLFGCIVSFVYVICASVPTEGTTFSLQHNNRANATVHGEAKGILLTS